MEAFTLGREAGATGEFERQCSVFRDMPGDFAPGRYHLYVASACPWAHRTLIVRRLKGLEDAIGVSHVAPFRDERGWTFDGSDDHVDAVHGWRHLREGYPADFEGRVGVPVLWDKRSVPSYGSQLAANAERRARISSPVRLRPRASPDRARRRRSAASGAGARRAGRSP